MLSESSGPMHGRNGPNLWEVSRTTTVAKLTHACSARWGYVDAGAKSRIQSTMKKFKRLGFLPADVSLTDICQKQDNNFFSQILSNENHVLHQLLPPVRNIPYSLRPRAHDRELPVANTAMRKISLPECYIPSNSLPSSKNSINTSV